MAQWEVLTVTISQEKQLQCTEEYQSHKELLEAKGEEQPDTKITSRRGIEQTCNRLMSLSLTSINKNQK